MKVADLLPPQPEISESFDPWLDSIAEFEKSARLLDLEPWIVERLRHAEQETSLNLLLAREDGSALPATALWVRHCSAAGPVVAPLRISRNTFLKQVRCDAMHMTWLTALYGLKFGGGATALILDPDQQSEKELRGAVRSLAGALHEPAASAAMILPAEARAVEMDWLESAWSEMGTGRPIIAGRASSSATSNAEEDIAVGLSELIRCSGGKVSAMRVAAQGFGSQMQVLLRRLHHAGARIVAVADESGGVSHPLGLDPMLLAAYVEEHGAVLGYPGADAVLNADVLAADCDLLILAGGERQILSTNVKSIQARVVICVARGAITEAAERHMSVCGKTVVSDLLCAGPALLSALSERDRGLSGTRLHAAMRRMIRATWREVVATGERWNVSHSHSGLTVAVQRVASIVRAKGI